MGPDGGVELTLTEEEARAFIAGLNDLRLYLSASATNQDVADLDRDSLVEWLGYNQDSLLTALVG